MRRPVALPSLIVAFVLFPAVVWAADAGSEYFEAKIRPVLVEHCYECHSAQAKKLGGNLLLDSRDAVRKGGESGEVIVPGKPDESLLVAAVRYSADSVHMPPNGKLSAEVIADFEEWVKLGAPDPRDTAPPPATSAEPWEQTLQVRRAWWSMQPVRRPELPPLADASWSTHPVDRFLQAALASQGLTPANAADPRTLLRRLSLVITGLPPTLEQTTTFLTDWDITREQSASGDAQAAIERLVDRLLASPHFGERFARHWLDIVRFSETHGNEWNYEVHHAWRYRDYLIRAFNNDLPYDQFVREHIAGDLLPQPRYNPQEQFNESVIGTAFYRFGEANHDDCIALRQIGYDLADNQIDTLSKAFQATTIACARCHNHKLDAVSTEDYYALLGVVRGSRQVSHTIDAPEVNAERIQRLRETKGRLRKELAELWQHDATEFARYLLAAQAKRTKSSAVESLITGLDPQRLEKWVAALSVEKAPREDPLEPWRAAAAADESEFVAKWRELATALARDDNERTVANEQQFQTYADFRHGDHAGWQVGGQGLREPPGRSGDFVVSVDGDAVVRAVLPAGCFTHAVSDKLNGTLRSPVLATGKQYISFQVMGQRSSALRLVSNNCQLNYKNYKALTSGDLTWITFEPPDDRESLRTYAELMTMFDNPKFPDQLSALGGDKENYKLPWEKAAENPRSYFGITRAVVHDGENPPQPELAHLRSLFAGAEPTTLTELANRYATIVAAAVQAWGANQATDDDVRWLDTLARGGLLSNSSARYPQLASLVSQYQKIEAELSLPRVVPGVADFGPGLDQAVLLRGDCWRPGQTVPRRYLEALSTSVAPFADPGSGRLEIANRIASSDNPFTARVMVNRIWHHVFGTGLVRTVDDFGHVGDLPSHPELLDYLAATFVEEGWSVKQLIRSLVLTRAFRAANRPGAGETEIDPQNRMLAHYPARRMEAETIRDSILATSGRLDGTLYGMSIQPYRDKENADRRLFPGPLDGAGRRSIYIKNNLMEAPKFLSAFDLPGGKVSRGRRDMTNVPAQALALLNDPFVLGQADEWAGRLVSRDDLSVAARIDAVFRQALCRAPTDEEQLRFAETVTTFAALHEVPTTDILRSRDVWRDVAHTVFNLKEFIFIP
ncbi:MAG TPA: PSD1 and planctomycete cytochrome C domain-containing protein [Pirellulales bacterium]|jgi:hypothetical protein